MYSHTMWLFIIVSFFLSILGLFGILTLWTRLTVGWCKSPTCLVGKTVIVTGANTGVGYATARDFAKRGAKVILACKDKENGEAARIKIVEATGNQNVVMKIIDLSSFKSVRAFAKDINASEDRLDILVNNAGIFEDQKIKTMDGFNLTMQVNYFSVFLLTNLLIELLKKSRPSRVVNVASVAGYWALYFNLDKIDKIAGHNMYPDSKLCVILFTAELARKLEGTGVTVYSLHPGFVNSDLFRFTKGLKKILINIGRLLVSKTIEEGAQTSVYCSLTKKIEKYSGHHFSDCRRVAPHKMMADEESLQKLWQISEKIVQLTPEELQTLKLE